MSSPFQRPPDRYEPPSYDSAYNEGFKRGYAHASTAEPMADMEPQNSPGWVSYNLTAPYAAGWKAGVAKFDEESDA